jgi:hypothetical protein
MRTQRMDVIEEGTYWMWLYDISRWATQHKEIECIVDALLTGNKETPVLLIGECRP